MPSNNHSIKTVESYNSKLRPKEVPKQQQYMVRFLQLEHLHTVCEGKQNQTSCQKTLNSTLQLVYSIEINLTVDNCIATVQ